MSARALIKTLRGKRSRANILGQRRFGITPSGEHLGIPIPTLRALARAHRRDHALACELFASGIHEARILAAYVDDPQKVTRRQMDAWAQTFDSWDVCDQVCGNLFCFAPAALGAAKAWTRKRAEFHKRAGFALMAALSVHRKDLSDNIFLGFLPLIRKAANDERNFVRKAVNWALRQIGKRNPRLCRAAILEAEVIGGLPSRSARWIASDALRELRTHKVLKSVRQG